MQLINAELPDFEAITLKHLAGCFRCLPGIRHAWETPPKHAISIDHMPCVYGLVSEEVQLQQSAGRITVGRVYAFRMLVLPFVAGANDPRAGADAFTRALPMLSRVRNYFRTNPRLVVDGVALPYLVTFDYSRIGGTGLVDVPIPGAEDYGSGCDFIFPIVQRATIPRTLRRV